MRGLYISLAFAMAITATQASGQDLSIEQIEQYLKQKACPKDLVTYNDVSYKQHCGENYITAMTTGQVYRCQMETDHINKQMHAFNDLIRKCRESGRRGGYISGSRPTQQIPQQQIQHGSGGGQSNSGRGAGPGTGGGARGDYYHLSKQTPASPHNAPQYYQCIRSYDIGSDGDWPCYLLYCHGNWCR